MNDLVSMAVGRATDGAGTCASLRMFSLTILLYLLGTALAGLPTNVRGDLVVHSEVLVVVVPALVLVHHHRRRQVRWKLHVHRRMGSC